MAETKVTLSLEFVFGHDDPDMPAEDADVLMEHAGDYEFLANFLRNSSYTLSKKKEVIEE